MPFLIASVAVEGMDNAMYHTACNNSKDEALATDRGGFRKATRQLCDNSPTSELLRHS